MIVKFIRFCIVGGSGVFVDFGITWLFKELLHFNKYIANAMGFLCAATSNFFLNRMGHSRVLWVTHQHSICVSC